MTFVRLGVALSVFNPLEFILIPEELEGTTDQEGSRHHL